ncbi:MAG TPA: TPM domain-containing protein, partial [Halioglobus sp.]
MAAALAVDSAAEVEDSEVAVHPATGNRQMSRRWMQHLTTTPLTLRRHFPRSVLAAIDAACMASEQSHRAEIRCAIEAMLPMGHLWRGVSSAARAVEVFSQLRMWDTAENNGVLLYVLLAERSIEIVADRGFAERVTAAEWRSICSRMEEAFRTGHYERGTLAALEQISALARQHFPGR